MGSGGLMGVTPVIYTDPAQARTRLHQYFLAYLDHATSPATVA